MKKKPDTGKGEQDMGIILWIILGALAGWIASKIMGTDRKQGLIADVVIGIIGANVGGFVASLLGMGGVNGFNLYSLIIAVAGACLFIWIISLFRKK